MTFKTIRLVFICLHCICWAKIHRVVIYTIWIPIYAKFVWCICMIKLFANWLWLFILNKWWFSMKHKKKDSFLPLLVSNPPIYSEVINCCIRAVFPTSVPPKTLTYEVDIFPRLLYVLMLSWEELEARDDWDSMRHISPSDEKLAEPRDLMESLLLFITPFELTLNILTGYLSASCSLALYSWVWCRWFKCNNVGFLTELFVGMLDVLGRIPSPYSRRSSCLSFMKEKARCRHETLLKSSAVARDLELIRQFLLAAMVFSLWRFICTI